MRRDATKMTALAAALATLAGCAGMRETVIPPAEHRLTPTERLLIDAHPADAPMEVVTNDTPAGDAFLRTKAAPIDVADPSLARLVARMRSSVEHEKGVGIAAPQVGVSRRVVIVQRLDLEPQKPFVVYLNPVITESAGEDVVEWEGCLSVPDGHAKVRRPLAITVGYDTAAGERESERVEGFTARIFLHEVDHLDGILFIDKREPGPLMPKDEYREMRRREKEKRESAERQMIETMKDIKAPVK